METGIRDEKENIHNNLSDKRSMDNPQRQE